MAVAWRNGAPLRSCVIPASVVASAVFALTGQRLRELPLQLAGCEMKRHLFLGSIMLIGLGGYAPDLFAANEAALAAFTTVQKVFQSPRCQNCHIPGDSPLQFGLETTQPSVRDVEE
ncbi:hypothetical protein [Pseudomonas fluorescens]|uniref:hypothetical protein n=1 Tax=Pseudomonas fluorescens TaxID=294 RepID=UPI0012426A5E|nr:hypothetical protein [Pseudomonas fluorescens]